MKKLVLFAFAILYYGVSISQTFTIDGLDYEVTSTNPNEVSITEGTPPTSDLLIPETVTDASITYTVVAIANSAFREAGLTSVSFPSSLRQLGVAAFKNNLITEVSLPESLTTIETEAFRVNQISTVIIPQNVTSIAAFAFSGGNPVVTVICEGIVPPSVALSPNASAFSNPQNIDLTVPPGTELAYETAGWIGFNSVNGVVNFEVGDTFTVSNFDYEVISLNPNEVAITGGATVPQNLIIPENVSSGASDFVVTAIGDSAFIASGLTSVTFPNTIRLIDNFAFENNQIESLVIPESVTAIDFRAFRLNQIGGSVVIPNSVTSLGNGAFELNNISEITISENISAIGDHTFRNNQLTTVTIPAGITAIGDNSFRDNPLTEVIAEATTPPSIANGDADSFLGSRSNINLMVPEAALDDYLNDPNWEDFFSINGQYTGVVPFDFDKDGFSFRIFDSSQPNNVLITGNTNSGTIIIPETVEENNVTFVPTRIGTTAFFDNNVTAVTIPNTITQIGDGAFANNALTIVTLPNTITQIFANAFLNNALTTVTIPNTITHIRSSSFANNALTTVTLPDNLEFIFANAFENNALTTVSIPSNVKAIGFNAFANNSLTSLHIEERSLDVDLDIGNNAFIDNQLTDITFPAFPEGSSIELGGGVFNNNPLETVRVEANNPNTITFNTATDAFEDRSSINLTVPEAALNDYLNDPNWEGFFSINGQYTGVLPREFTVDEIRYSIIEGGVLNKVRVIDNFNTGVITLNEEITENNVQFVPTVIGNDAFNGNNISEVTIPNTILEIDNGAFINNPLTTVTIPDSVTRLGLDAFKNSTLETVDLGAGLEIIDNGAFLNNDLTSIIIPASVTTIGDGAFNGNSLGAITSLAIQPPTIITNSFGNRSLIDLFIPTGTLQAYTDANWTGFNSITEITIDITVAPKVFLQGASLNPITGEEDLMRDSLRVINLLPTTSPYGDGATVNPSVFDTTGANAIVDWILVELRTGVDNENTIVVNSEAALLQRDGDIVDVDGVSTITFTEEEGDYFIAIIHRNHIGILAAVPTSLSNTATALDFTQDVTSAKGENLALTTLVNGNFAMIAGDADGSSQILNTDITEGLTLAGGGESYSNADADMNGFVLNSDIQLLILGNSGTVQQFD